MIENLTLYEEEIAFVQKQVLKHRLQHHHQTLSSEMSDRIQVVVEESVCYGTRPLEEMQLLLSALKETSINPSTVLYKLYLLDLLDDTSVASTTNGGGTNGGGVQEFILVISTANIFFEIVTKYVF